MRARHLLMVVLLGQRPEDSVNSAHYGYLRQSRDDDQKTWQHQPQALSRHFGQKAGSDGEFGNAQIAVEDFIDGSGHPFHRLFVGR